MITQEDKKRLEALIEIKGQPRDKEALRIILRIVADFFNDINDIAHSIRGIDLNGKR